MCDNYMFQWRTFSHHLTAFMAELYQGSHTDVTLVCDGQRTFQAHKVVLRACSPVFRDILDNNPHPQPLIYLMGVQHEDLQAVLQFMYLGQTSCRQDRVTDFLRTANNFRVKEIAHSGECETEQSEFLSGEIKVEVEVEDMVESGGEIKVESGGDLSAAREEGKSVACAECEATFTQRASMLRHFRSKHEGVKYNCQSCQTSFTTKADLKRHRQSVHEGVKYPCSYCDYQATQASDLKRHVQCAHEGVRYPCTLCDYQATQQNYLNRHVKLVHKVNNVPNTKIKIFPEVKTDHDMSPK